MRKTAVAAAVTTLLTLTPSGARALDVGDTAPLFTAASSRGEVRLTDYAGKKHVVLAFYFAVNTSA